MEGIAELDINDDVIPKTEVQRHLLNMTNMFFQHNILPSQYKKESSNDIRYIIAIQNAYKSRGQSLEIKKKQMEKLRLK